MVVKICGLTNEEDILLCDSEGADMLGFIFIRQSPRYVEKGSKIFKLKTRAKKVAVLSNPEIKNIEFFAEHFEFVQLHGLEERKTINEFKKLGLKIIKTIFPEVEESVKLCFQVSDVVDLFLVDSSSKLKGVKSSLFSLEKLKDILDSEGKIFGINYILSGGLNPENVVEFLKMLKPYGVDVASGVEDSPGKKSPEKVRKFILSVKNFS